MKSYVFVAASSEGAGASWRLSGWCGYDNLGLTCSELGVLSALLRELSESEAIKYVCISKSRFHEIKKSLLEMIDLGQKTHTRKTGKTVWSLRETDRFGIIYSVNGNV